MSIALGTAIAYLTLDAAGFTGGLRTAMQDLQQVGQQGNTISDNFKNVGSALTNVGTTMTKNVTVPLVGMGAAILKTGQEFEYGLSEVQGISKATGDDMEKLKSKAMDLGATTKFSATESAEAFKYMAMAGWDTEKMLGGIEGVMSLAAASGEELGLVSDIVTDSLTAFGMAAEDSGKFANILAEAATSSNTNVAMMGETFKYVAPIAGTLGMSAEDVAVAVGLMANAGIKGSQAGTTLRAALVNLTSPTTKAAVEMQTYGIEVKNADGSIKSLQEIMGVLREKLKVVSDEQLKAITTQTKSIDTAKLLSASQESLTEQELKYRDNLHDGLAALDMYTAAQYTKARNVALTQEEIAGLTEEQQHYLVALRIGIAQEHGMTEAQQASAAATIFGKEAMSGMLSIINATDEDYGSLTEKIYGAQDAFDGQGTAAGIAATMQDNLKSKIEQLGGAFETLQLLLYDRLVPIVSDIVLGFTNFLDNLTKLNPEILDNVVKWGLVAAAIGPVLIIIGKIISIFGILGSAFTAIAGFVGPLVSTFGLLGGTLEILATGFAALTGPIGLVIAAGVALYAAWTTNFGGIQEKTKEIFESIKEIITSVIKIVQDLVKAFLDLLKKAWETDFLAIRTIVETAWKLIEQTFSKYLDILVSVFKAVSAVLKGDWDTVWKELGNIVKTAFDIIKNTVTTVLGLIKDVIQGVLKTIADITSAALTTVLNFIKGILDNIFNGIKGFIGNGTGAIQTFFTTIVNTAQSMMQSFFNGIINIIQQIPGAFEGGFSGVINFLMSLPGQFYNIGTDIMQNLFNGLQEIWGNITSWFSDVTSKIANFVTGSKSKINDVNSATSNLSSGARGSYASGLDYVPYDGYVAVLHEGERIQTAQQVKNNSSGNTTFTINNLNINSKMDIQKTAQELADLYELEKRRRGL